MKILFFDKTNVELKQKLEKIGLECVDEKEKDQKGRSSEKGTEAQGFERAGKGQRGSRRHRVASIS